MALLPCLRCGYELRGLGADALGMVKCPECGSSQPRNSGSNRTWWVWISAAGADVVAMLAVAAIGRAVGTDLVVVTGIYAVILGAATGGAIAVVSRERWPRSQRSFTTSPHQRAVRYLVYTLALAAINFTLVAGGLGVFYLILMEMVSYLINPGC